LAEYPDQEDTFIWISVGPITLRLDNSPSLDDLAKIAEAALADIPAPFRQRIEDVVLRIEELPDDMTLTSLGIGNPLNLLGLYRGVPLGKKRAGAIVQNVDVIFLYRRPLLEQWRLRGGLLGDLVRHVLVHEIGHHFGLSDNDMTRIERGPD
jgi:predicted Zn-dependent protease with MMP-like domain